MIPGWEFLADEPRPARALRFMQAMRAAAPAGTVTTKDYAGQHQNLMLYGPGAPHRMAAIAAHRKRGGRVAMWDLGYWDREDSMRLAVDLMHPTAEQLALAPADSRRKFVLREDADPTGPILLVGLGAKSVAAYGLGRSLQWETAKLSELRQRFPGRQIVWRPKGRKVVPLRGTTLRHGMSIEDAMCGCSLVVCRHSNVAVDAAVAGIPVECEGGAAAALYAHGSAPDASQRLGFLQRLSWWNWSPAEAPQAWEWIKRLKS